MAGQEPLIWPQQDDPDEPRLTDGVDEAGESLLTPSPHDDPDGSDAQPPDGLVAAQLWLLCHKLRQLRIQHIGVVFAGFSLFASRMWLPVTWGSVYLPMLSPVYRQQEHVGCGVVMLLAAVLQLDAPTRKAYPRLHRWTGRVYVAAGWLGAAGRPRDGCLHRHGHRHVARGHGLRRRCHRAPPRRDRTQPCHGALRRARRAAHPTAAAQRAAARAVRDGRTLPRLPAALGHAAVARAMGSARRAALAAARRAHAA
jgi:hypothetical protein